MDNAADTYESDDDISCNSDEEDWREKAIAAGWVDPGARSDSHSTNLLDTDDLAIRNAARRLTPREMVMALLSSKPEETMDIGRLKSNLKAIWLATCKEEMKWDRFQTFLHSNRSTKRYLAFPATSTVRINERQSYEPSPEALALIASSRHLADSTGDIESVWKSQSYYRSRLSSR
jgi:hypothetical protein